MKEFPVQSGMRLLFSSQVFYLFFFILKVLRPICMALRLKHSSKLLDVKLFMHEDLWGE